MRQEGRYVTLEPDVLDPVLARGLSQDDIFIFRLGFCHMAQRVIIPVYFENVQVQHLARAYWWVDFPPKPKYLYGTGPKISQFIFNWDEAKAWPAVTLVENTFNAIRWRNLGVTTNFGSHLSSDQARLLQISQAKSVVILWDADAIGNAEKAVKQLRELGIPALRMEITGQPDFCFKYSDLSDLLPQAHRAAQNGKIYLDCR